MSYFIKEVSFGSEVVNGEKVPEYKVDTYINIEQVHFIKPTKNPLVLKAIIGSKESFILKSDWVSNLP